MGDPLGRASGAGTGTGTDAAASADEEPARRTLSAVAASPGFHRSLRTVPVPLSAVGRLAAAGALVRIVHD
jgi:hypothetical protein